MDDAQRRQEDEATRRLLGNPGGQLGQAAPNFQAPSTPAAALQVNRDGVTSAGTTSAPGAAFNPAADFRAQQDAATRALLGQPPPDVQLGGAPPGTRLDLLGPAPAAAPGAGVGLLAVPATSAGALAGGGGLAVDPLAASPAARPEADEAARRLLGPPGGAGLGEERLARRRTATGEQRATSREAKRAAERAEAEITCFKVVINGEIESAQLSGGSKGPLMCVFSVQHGPDWTVVSGTPNGITQVACSAAPVLSSIAATIRGGGMREVVWNFPVGLVFKSTSPFGWPRIAVTVYGTDLCNRRVVKGYGSVHIPCQPGRHARVIRLYCPLSSSPLTRLLGALFGNPAQLVDPRVITGTEGREVVRVQTGGKVRVIFEVLLKDTEPFNYTF